MKSIIVGTAGHIDHGKTALVKALTGIDADRLDEEKRRGITIDLGFAHIQLPGSNGEVLQLGFVDVPGHERFVRNMLAGVGGIDLVLLVIAADESIKPQTREHFDILQMLGVQRGITVLTKSDNVDAETLDVVRLEVEEFLRGTFLEPPKAPIIGVSSLTGAGLGDLKRAMLAAAAQVQPRDSQAIARLPIDRVFTMKGFGTVVTGTLIAGTIRKDEELELFPSGRRVRVRGIQVHGHTSDEASAGQRTALNLTGATTEDISRGMMLAPPKIFASTRQVDVQLRLLPSAPRPIKQRARAHFHSHTMETVAELRVIGNSQIRPGETLFARALLPEPTLLLPGDRFILRQFSPMITIGGGIILDALPRLRLPKNDDALAIFAEGDVDESLRKRIFRTSHQGISISRLIAESGLTKAAIETALAAPLRATELVRIGDELLGAGHLEALKVLIGNSIADFQKKNPLEQGIAKERLREQTKAEPSIFDRTLEMLAIQKKIEIAGDLVRLPGQGVVMKDEEAESKKKIEEAFAGAGLKVPALHEVLAGLRIDKVRAQKIVTLLLRERALIKISEELVFHRTALEELRRQITSRKEKSATIDVAAFKDMTGVTRKYAIPLLEYLDRERVTKRVGDSRQIL